jgi:hypothetical protein
MKRLSIILAMLFLIAGTSANAQMHGEDDEDMHPDTSYYMNEGYHHGMHGGGHMPGHGMMPGMMHRGLNGQMGNMHGMMMGNRMMNFHSAGMMHFGMFTRLNELREELDLSSEKANRLEQIKANFMSKREELYQKVVNEREKLLEAVNNEVTGEKYRNQLISYYHSLIALQGETYETFNEMKGLLNNEQKQKLINRIAETCPYCNGNPADEEDMKEHHRRRMHHHNMMHNQ